MLRLLLPPSVGAARARARAELLDQSLRADLGETLTIEVADGYAELAERAERGEADVVWMPPTVCARLEPSLASAFKCVRQGSTSYRSAIVAKRGTHATLDELRDARPAWVDRLSVGGHLLARAALAARGLADTLREPRFFGSYPAALEAVLDHEADFAAVAVRDDSAAALREALAAYVGKVAVDALACLFVTGDTPNDAVGVTRAVEPRAADRLARRVFENERARARAAFCLALDAEGFVRAVPGEYAELRRLLTHA
ncbi:MAG: PhnD/SsuA/transferrin family substrate-binding protein [Sandaracinaceae bacterium]|nr:PhnD/SsuA/transferrin family substrate-binding protein [Sandaracinaceae bacterium]